MKIKKPEDIFATASFDTERSRRQLSRIPHYARGNHGREHLTLENRA
jgi:hypothetical protein